MKHNTMTCNYNLHKQGVRRNTINHTNGNDCYCEQHQEQKHKGGENVTASNAMYRNTNEKNYKTHNMTISNTKNKTLKQSLKQTKGKTITNKISKVQLGNKT
jgi:hypothetical protein